MNTKTILSGLGMLSTFMMGIQVYAKSPQPQAVKEIDVQQYLGEWYEIARLPMYFQRQCASDVKATYQLNEDKTLNVINRCRNEKGQLDISTGVAYPDNQGNSKLKVSFLPHGLQWIPFTRGDYWILRIDPDYQVALVGGSSHKYLWLLSRTPGLDETTIQSYLKTAQSQGYDLSDLIRTRHHPE